jgi:hypothetical protein
VPPGACLQEEGVESIVTDADRLLRRHLPGRLDAVLEALYIPPDFRSEHQPARHGSRCLPAWLKSEAM